MLEEDSRTKDIQTRRRRTASFDNTEEEDSQPEPTQSVLPDNPLTNSAMISIESAASPTVPKNIGGGIIAVSGSRPDPSSSHEHQHRSFSFKGGGDKDVTVPLGFIDSDQSSQLLKHGLEANANLAYGGRDQI